MELFDSTISILRIQPRTLPSTNILVPAITDAHFPFNTKLSFFFACSYISVSKLLAILQFCSVSPALEAFCDMPAPLDVNCPLDCFHRLPGTLVAQNESLYTAAPYSFICSHLTLTDCWK